MSNKSVKRRSTSAKVIDRTVGQEKRLFCVHCNIETYHTVLAHIRCTDSEYFYQNVYDSEPDFSVDYWEDFFTLQCGGCRRVSIYLTQHFSEDEEWAGEKFFPHDPDPSRKLFMEEEVLPPKIEKIYDEAVKAFDNGMPILAGMGIRAVVETLCKACDAKGKSLASRIDAMVDKGLITKDGAKILHSLRVLGNAAAHDVEPHTLGELTAAFDVIDHLLQGVYTIPARAKELPQK